VASAPLSPVATTVSGMAVNSCGECCQWVPGALECRNFYTSLPEAGDRAQPLAFGRFSELSPAKILPASGGGRCKAVRRGLKWVGRGRRTELPGVKVFNHTRV
jgi:hypothetical protein